MSVVLGSFDDFHAVLKKKLKCNMCEETICRYPFLHWDCTPDILICSECCRTNKEGFTADLIQITAIAEFQALKDAYCNFTFVRRDIERLEKEYARQRAEELRLEKRI